MSHTMHFGSIIPKEADPEIEVSRRIKTANLFAVKKRFLLEGGGLRIPARLKRLSRERRRRTTVFTDADDGITDADDRLTSSGRPFEI